MKAKVYVTLKSGVLDPQGQAVQHSLGVLGFSGVEDVRVGRYIELQLQGNDRRGADVQVQRMCKELLANPVIESFKYDIES